MKSRPYLRMFAWIAIAIAISVSSYHLLYPDFAQREVASADSRKVASVRESSAAQAPREPLTRTTRAAERPEPAKQTADRLARLHRQRDELEVRLRANPDDPSLHAELQQLAAEEEQLTAAKAKLLNVPPVTVDGARLSHFDGDQPVYLRDNNANASISTAATQIRSTSPYNVTGSGVIIGLWESGGLPRDTHNDLTGRVTLGDTDSTSFHATHVAGTLIGDGTTSASVLGMAPGATVDAYTVGSTSDHVAEATAIAATAEGEGAKIYLSNHSYSTATGWYLDSNGNRSWYGSFTDDGNAANDQVKPYGQYGFEARSLDDLANDHPYLTMFFAAGNDRGYDTPSSGGTWYLNGNTDTAYTYDPATHPKDNEDWMVDGSITGYGTISPQSSAKNVISIGAVNDAVSGGSRSTGAATMSDFSSYGPTDDGRIKPDLVANGVSVKSLSNTSNSATSTASGTSMASPNAAGTAALLVDYFDNKFPGESMRSSMLKALLIHTADDLGNPGPDYRYGWGLIDAKAAADVIEDTAANTTKGRLLDGKLSTTDASDTFTFDYDGSGEVRVTLVWNDPKGSSTSSHDDRTARLKHDLNLTVTGPDGTHYPYLMPWAGDWSDSKLNDTATTGVNTVDNVEQVYLSAPVSGSYTITIDHAGSLVSDQIYSLVLTGGDFASEAPDGGSNLNYSRVSGFGTIEPFNIYETFSSAHETTYTISVDDPSVVTAAIDGSGNVIITEAGVGSTTVYVTATNDLGQSDTVQITVTVSGNVIYVDASNTSATQDGNTWATAYDELTEALAAASSGQQIWVAAGIYYPNPPETSPTAGDQIKSFNILGGVPIYGGFAGNETSLDDRDFNANLSILSGDLDRNDSNRADGITDLASEIVGNNTWTLIFAESTDDNFVLDGLVITAAATDSNLTGNSIAPAINIQSGCNNGTIANCRFHGFAAEGAGGAVYVNGTGTTFENCSFSGISAGGNGGAIFAAKAISLTDCVFQSNTAAAAGGAVHLNGSTHVIRRCTFQGNVSQDDGGAISFSTGGTGVITNCLITGNSASGSAANGGAIIANNGAYLTITNSTLCSNYSKLDGGALAIAGASTVNFSNSIAWANAVNGNSSHANAFSYLNDPASSSLVVLDSLDQGAVDPMLTNVPAATSTGTLAGDFHLTSASPAIDEGDDQLAIDASGGVAGLAGDETSDLAGNTRNYDGDYDGAPEIDYGCYECDEPAIIATIGEVTVNFSTGATSSTLDLDDYFGGNGLSFVVVSSSPDLIASVDSDHILTLSLANGIANDSAYTVTITATDDQNRTLEQTVTVTFELTRIYVNAAATGTGTGHTWADAVTELRDAFALASTGDEIWVAQGIYKPSAADPTAQFVTLDGLSVYGGFSGDETSVDEADPATFLTVLSGDIDGDDTVDAHGVTLSYLDHGPGGGNTSAPLVAIPASTSATLSGLTICGAASSGIQSNSSSTLTLSDCVIRGNKKSGDGGAIDALGSSHSISDCQFLENHATSHGGGVRFGPSASHRMTFDRCVIAGNASNGRGGGLAFKSSNSANNSRITMSDCLFSGNHSGIDGGAIHSWIGGTNLDLTNCTIAANHADGNGASIFVTNGITLKANNCLVSGNSGNVFVGGFAAVTWRSSLIENSGGSAAWDSAFGTDGGNNLDTDPLFLSLPDAATAPTLAGDFTFDAGSPAYDAGNDALSSSSLDVIGNARVFATAIDFGAYENLAYLRPSFYLDSDDSTTHEDNGPVLEEGFAEGMNANDAGQSLTGFVLTTDNDALFSVLPTVNLSGDLSYTPAPDAYGTATVTIVLYDDGPSANVSLPLTFPITIYPETDAPTDVALDNTSVPEGSTFIGTVTATEPFGQPITWSIVIADDGQAFTIDANTGELSFVYPLDFENPIDGDADNEYLVFVRATGSDGAQIVQFTITVTDVNEKPTFELSQDISVNEDSGAHLIANYAFNFDAIDAGQTLDHYEVSYTTTSGTMFTVEPAIDTNGTLTFTLIENVFGVIDFTVVAVDDPDDVTNGRSEPVTARLYVTGIDDPPTDIAITFPGNSAKENQTLAGTITATEPFGEELAFELIGGADYELFTLDGQTGVLSFITPPDFEIPTDANQDGLYQVEIIAHGSDGASRATLSVTVLDVVEVFYWTNASGDNLWTTSGNWDKGAPPSPSDVAFLSNASTTLLNDGSAQSLASLWVGDGGGAGDLRLSNASQIAVSKELDVGDGLNDVLSLLGGSGITSSGRLRIFAHTDSITTISLSGGSQWTHTYGDTIDQIGGSGTVNWSITGGSSMILAHATPTKTFKMGLRGTLNLTVSGTGSSFDHGAHHLQLGTVGDLTLLVEDGATFGNSSSGGLTLGQSDGRTVSAQILTGASLRSGGSLLLLDASTLLMDDASLELDTLWLADGSVTLQGGSTGTVNSIDFTGPNMLLLDGTGTHLTVTGASQTIGDGGDITVAGGAAITYTASADFNLYNGDFPGSFLVTEAGSSATFTGGLTNTSTGESATFTVSDGASASFGGAINLTGTHGLNFTGSGTQVSVTGDFTLGGGGNTLTLDSAATLKIGGRLSSGPADTISLLGGATLDIVTINSNFTNSAGILHLADAAAAATIDGNYTQESAATLSLGLGGTTPGTGYDTLAIDGTASLAGTLKIELLDEFAPALGDSFTVLTCSALTDNGLAFDLPALASGLAWETQIGSQTITLTVVASNPLTDFRTQYGLASDGSDDNADWSQNGVANIFYHLFGLGDPNEETIDRSLLPTLTATDGHVTFSYRCPFPFVPVYSLAVTSNDLVTWTPLDQLSGDEAPVDVTASMETDGYLRYSFTIPTTSGKRFFSVQPQATAAE